MSAPGFLAKEKELSDSANAKREEEERWRAEREAYWAEREAWEAKHPVLSSVEQFCSSVLDSVRYFLEEYGTIVLFIIIFVFPLLLFTGFFGIFTRILNGVKLKKFRKKKINLRSMNR